MFNLVLFQWCNPGQVEADGQIVKTGVNVSVRVEEILKVDELDSLFSCKIELLLSWRDQVHHVSTSMNLLRSISEVNV